MELPLTNNMRPASPTRLHELKTIHVEPNLCVYILGQALSFYEWNQTHRTGARTVDIVWIAPTNHPRDLYNLLAKGLCMFE